MDDSLKLIKDTYPYLMSNIDRDPLSKTVGCCDRLHWAWKIKDFPDATLQRFIYPLAYIMKNTESLSLDEKGIILSILRFTRSILNDNGSVNQAYPYESSHAGTGFLLLDIILAYRTISVHLDEEERREFYLCCKPMADYLMRNDETHGIISNHLLGTAASLYYFHKTFDEGPEYEDRGDYYTGVVKKASNSEGWLEEYGGADPGYQSLALYYTARILELRQDEELIQIALKCIEFCSHFFHPDGSYGGEYGSRNTEIPYPGGFSFFSSHSSTATSITAEIKKRYLGYLYPLNYDAGNIAPLLSNLIMFTEYGAVQECIENLPYKKEFTKFYQDAGIFVASTDMLYTVIGVSKGGVVKIFDKQAGSLIVDDCGSYYFDSGELYSSQFLQNSSCVLEGESVTVVAGFAKVNRQVVDPFRMAVLRLVLPAISRFGFMRELVKKLIVKVLISPNKPVRGMTVHKRISIRTGEIEREMDNKPETGNVVHGGKFSTIHMATSRYFHNKKSLD
ncbi:hypothetical protein [Limisalsivibrio acetivorans]|uniref:hypothetical protein n=1 Tax=Limisalsivibrio acetivorans TaxID=1304888 RepID=UPI0003B2E8F2|nr:hypothetical protein [Limisalsivibrio acetivorans]